MKRNIALYCASLVLTIILAGALVLEIVWFLPMGLAGAAIFVVLEYVKIWSLRTIIIRQSREIPPYGGVFAGIIGGLFTLLSLASGLSMVGILTERLILSVVVLLLVELGCLAVSCITRRARQDPFQLLYASVGKIG